MSKIKTKSTAVNINQINARCRFCKAKQTAENKLLPRIDYKETENLNMKQQIKYFESEIQSLKQELHEKDNEL